ncbi:MAG: hypothetical protein ACSHWU_07720 [Marinicella sp.]
MRLFFIFSIFLLLLIACNKSSNLKNNRSATEYLKHLANTPATSEHEIRETFGMIFDDFKSGATEENIRKVYADKLYFNDTFKIIGNIEDLIHYLSHSAEQVENTHVEILDVIRSEEDYFIRWSMKMQLKIKGKEINSHSIGMTQIRFNQAGKIMFHQDFWDSSEAFFEHLPFMGRFVKNIKSML